MMIYMFFEMIIFHSKLLTYQRLEVKLMVRMVKTWTNLGRSFYSQ